jgi:hypothetical protein
MSNTNDQAKKLDQLKILARTQSAQPRTARDLSVLEAARSQAVLNRQKLPSVQTNDQSNDQSKSSQGWRAWFAKPVWAGAGSLVGIAFVGLLVTQQEWRDKAVEPKPQIAQAPPPTDAAAPSAAPAPVELLPAPAAKMPVPVDDQRTSAVVQSPVKQSEKRTEQPETARRNLSLPSAKSSVKPAPAQVVTRSSDANSQGTTRESADVAVASAPTVKPDAAPSTMPKLSAPAPVADVAPVSPASSISAPRPAPAPEVVGALERKKALQDFSLKKNQSAMSSSVDQSAWNAEQCLRFFRQVPEPEREVFVSKNLELIKNCRFKLPDQRWPTDLQWLQ